MKRPSEAEQAALEAAFFSSKKKSSRDPEHVKKLTLYKTAKTTAEIWHGWRFNGDELVDAGGNRYGQNEIRAIFYTRQQLRYYEAELKSLKPPPLKPEPIQLSFPFEPLFRQQAV